MKKLLLTFWGAILSMTAGAQTLNTLETLEVRDVQDVVEMKELGRMADPTASTEKPAGSYVNMQGVYFIGMSENGTYNPSSRILAAPNFSEIKFASYYGKDATGVTWKYVDPSEDYNMFNPQLQSTDSVLAITYKYDKRNTQIEAPALTITNGTTDSTFQAADYMMVGGVFSTTNGGKFYWANNSSKFDNYIRTNSNYYVYNSTTVKEKWEELLEVSDLRVRGFAEYFKHPNTPYYLNGVMIYGVNEGTFNSNPKVTISKCRNYSASGNLSSVLETLATATIDKSTIGAVSATYPTRYKLMFKDLKDAEGNDIDGLIVNSAIIITLTFDDETTQFKPYFNYSPKVNSDYHAYMLADYTKGSSALTDQYVNVALNFSSGAMRAFKFYINADYDWIKHIGSGDKPYTGKTFSDVPASGDAQSITLHASEEYQDALGLTTNWKVEAPDWMTVALTDNRDDEKNYLNTTELTVTVKPNTGEAREGKAIFKYKAATYNVTIKQLGVSTAITTVNADQQNDADAPAYNLAGQRVDSSVKGIIIKNGKKYVVK